MRRKLQLFMLLLFGTILLQAQDSTKQRSLEIYGFAMTDMGYDTKQINPNWF